MFCAMIPQYQVRRLEAFFTLDPRVPEKAAAEEDEAEKENEPSGFHLIPLPYADDIRPAPINEAAQGIFSSSINGPSLMPYQLPRT